VWKPQRRGCRQLQLDQQQPQWLQQQLSAFPRSSRTHPLNLPPPTPPRPVDIDDLTKLTYLNAVINEGMRLHPAAALGSIRETTQPTKIGPYTVPKGTLIWPLIYAMQNSIHNWDKAAEFIPVSL
jgi:cytochrome P450